MRFSIFETGSISLARLASALPRHYYDYAATVRIYTGAEVFVRSGSSQLASTGGAGPAVVDLNAATASDLDSLPGVGPVMAGRILDWRTAHGRFTSVDQLREV